MKNDLVASGNAQAHAMRDPLCLMYYPMRRDCYWCVRSGPRAPHSSDRAPML